MAFNQLDVGVQQNGDGAIVTARAGKGGETMVSELNGRYYEQAYRGNMFYAVNSAAQALSLSGTTTYTGLAVANPTGSGKNLAIDEIIWVTTIAPTGVGAVIVGTSATVALTTGSSSGPAGTSCLIGGGSGSVAKVGASCTLGGNPTFLRPLIGIVESSAAGYATVGYKDDVGGGLIVAPGQQIELVAITTAITGVGYISWVELTQ